MSCVKCTKKNPKKIGACKPKFIVLEMEVESLLFPLRKGDLHLYTVLIMLITEPHNSWNGHHYIHLCTEIIIWVLCYCHAMAFKWWRRMRIRLNKHHRFRLLRRRRRRRWWCRPISPIGLQAWNTASKLKLFLCNRMCELVVGHVGQHSYSFPLLKWI